MTTMANYSINWNATYASVTGVSIGTFQVTTSGGYQLANSTNYAASPVVRCIALSVPQNNVGVVQYNGDVPPSITGITNTASGFARLTSSGTAEWVAAYGPTDIPLGPCVNAVLQLDFSGSSDSYTPYTLAELSEVAADNSAALQTALDNVPAGGKVLVAPGTYYFTETVYSIFENGDRNISIESIANSVDSGSGMTRFVWNKTREKGTAASITCTYQGVVELPYTWTEIQYLTVTGVSGASTAWIGKLITLGNAARSYWNVRGIVVAYNSATSIVVGIQTAGTNVAVPTNTDGNNGSITWEVWSNLLEIRGRDVTVRGIQMQSTGGANVKPGALICLGQTNDGVVETHVKLENMYMGSADAVSLPRACVEIGRLVIPDPGTPYYLLEGGYPRPFVPLQGDYLHMTNVMMSYADRGVFCGNPTGQVRGNSALLCEFTHLGTVFDGLSNFTNTAEILDIPGSLQFDLTYCSGAAISGKVINVTRPNGLWNVHGCYFEGDINQFARCYVGGASYFPLNITNSMFDLSSFDGAVGFIEWRNGPINIDNCLFRPVTPTGFKILCDTGGVTVLNVTNCLLPNSSETGGEVLQFGGSATGYIRRRGCSQWTMGSGTMAILEDRDWALNPTSAGGQHLQKVKSLSAGWDPCVNFIGTVTVSGASTTGTWTFGTAESSATALVAFVGPSVSETGTPAVDSYIVTKQSIATTGVTVTVYGAPGVGNSVTFPVFIVRSA